MPSTIARGIVILAGLSLCLFAIAGLVVPQKLLQRVKAVMDADWGIYFAVLIRLALGLALIAAAPASRYPVAFLFVGWVAIAAAAAGMLLGKQRLRGLTDWWIRRFSPAVTRLWLLIAIGFGAFLIYGAT